MNIVFLTKEYPPFGEEMAARVEQARHESANDIIYAVDGRESSRARGTVFQLDQHRAAHPEVLSRVERRER